jgi:aryl-alcohol dehydrogenase-like predicted oxidoreductase
METRTLGSSGIRVSVIGLGCNNFGALDVERSRRVVDRAIDLGITLFDTADVYGNRGGSESQLGEILGARRSSIVLATKFGMPMDGEGKKMGASPAYIAEAVDASLKRLKTDVIDLYQLHRPDPKTPIAETLGALNDLVKKGKVRAIGCSNMPAAELDAAHAEAAKNGWAHFVTAQDEYSLVNRSVERELLPAIERHRMGLLPYFPLASGLLTGKYSKGAEAPSNTRFGRMKPLTDRYMTEENWRIVEGLTQFVHAKGRTLLELAFSWLLAQPTLASVIAGATRAEQIEQNVAAASWKLTKEEIAEVNHITAKG